MKNTVLSLLTLLAVSSTCMAQSINVTVNPGAKSSCAFAALSLTDGFVNNITIGSAGGGAGGGSKASFSPVTVAKSADKCSIELIQDLFLGTDIPSVVIKVSSTTASATPELTLTLTHVFVTSVSDAASASTAKKTNEEPLEKVTFIFESITIVNPGGSLTCSVATNRCS